MEAKSFNGWITFQFYLMIKYIKLNWIQKTIEKYDEEWLEIKNISNNCHLLIA